MHFLYILSFANLKKSFWNIIISIENSNYVYPYYKTI